MMNSNNNTRSEYFKKLNSLLIDFSSSNIESAIMHYCLLSYGIEDKHYGNPCIEEILKKNAFQTDLEFVIEFFESLLEKNTINENGIVFTPQYISDYISEYILNSPSISQLKKMKVIDPGCGCGIFLVSFAEKLNTLLRIDIDFIISNIIHGIDLLPDNVNRCILILKLLSAKHGGKYTQIKPNIICADSLKSNWNELFHVNNFDAIIGNPPYVNPHDMNKDTVEFLKNNFVTTKKGVFNIFYAFIEKSMNFLNLSGKLGFIIPNNFLTIKAASDLRNYITSNEYLEQIIDFGTNMIFKPVRTYNAIVFLSKQKNTEIKYHIMPSSTNIKKSLCSIHFGHISNSALLSDGWQLTDTNVLSNLRKMESQWYSIKDFIKTGIATLKDNVYFVEKDNIGFYKEIDSKKLYIENEIVKPVYKIPELKLHDNPNDVKRYIIFPYKKNKGKFEVISEFELINKYPKTFEYLVLQREILNTRDKGNSKLPEWFAYGRSQGLNKYGKKLLFPTFSNKPKFMYISNEDALFCNGYAIFENEIFPLDVLQKILNSSLVDYYVSHTSYSIEGGFYCYQKKYLEKFSIPYMKDNDISFIRKSNQEDVNKYLWDLYGLVS